jgi:carboxypeptidase Q
MPQRLIDENSRKKQQLVRLILFLVVALFGATMCGIVIFLIINSIPPTTEFDVMIPDVIKIKYSIYNGTYGKHHAYETVARIADKFGSRIVGSVALDNALNYVADILKNDGFENVTLEKVNNITHWVRNKASLTLVSPYVTELPILALGTSVGTPPEGITAQIMVVSDFDELDRRKDEVKGKIVVYNVVFVTYGTVYPYRANGASRAAKYGALAVLVRSATPFSIRSPHTGVQRYDPTVPKIPAASITLEDADMFARMVGRGDVPTVTLFMSCENLPDISHHNVYGDFTGSKYPNEVIVLGGHMDSWDVGQGAMDDLGGAMVCYAAVRSLIKLGLRPLRTIRFVGWVDEEVSGRGAETYAAEHNMNDHILAMESDMGTFKPVGINLFSDDATFNIFNALFTSLLSDMNVKVTRVNDCGSTGADIADICASGTPALHVMTDNARYFWFHHSQGDMVSVLNATELDQNTAFIATMIHAIANRGDRLPRHQ